MDARFTQSSHTGLLVTTEDGQVVFEKDSQTSFVPASTTKLLTAYLSLKHWGVDYHFKTRFYLKNKQLTVQGLGDPFLVSEEISHLVNVLSKRLSRDEIYQIQLDTSHYESGLLFDVGQRSTNPYDAIASPLAANFNTLHLKKRNGVLFSAESQTPITATSRLFKHQAGQKATRMNTGTQRATGERYFAELLQFFLAKKGIKTVFGNVWVKPSQDVGKLIYTHENSRNLSDVVKPMMRYSTNFIANQLALNLAADKHHQPASQPLLQKMYLAEMKAVWGWKNALIADGAGLSKQNKLTPQQLVALLNSFEPWRHLLPEIMPGVFAKSGTLNHVSTLAGYIFKHGQWYRFAVMMNEKTPYRYRNRVVTQIKNAL